MDRRFFGRAWLGIIAAAAAAGSARTADAADGKTHRAAFDASSEDRRAQQLVLGNAHNYAAYYKAKGEPFMIEIVAFGPGFSLVRGDMSMVKGEVEALQKDLGSSLVIRACANTRKGIAESMGKKAEDIPLLPGVQETPSGVVRLAELQEQGWAYLRP